MEQLTVGGRGERPLRVLVVASWFPALDDTSKGRFVADQVLALSRAGAMPAVLSFEPLRTSGGLAERREQIVVARRSIEAAVRAHPDELFSARAWAVAGEVPVARVPIVQAGEALEGPLHKLEARSALVEPLAVALGAWRPDVVHAHTIYPDGAMAARLADRLGCPLVVTEHAHFLDALAEVPEIGREIAATIGRASAVVCVGRGLAATVRRVAPAAGPRLRVLPNAVDLTAFTPAPLDERTPDQLLFVGYRAEVKGVDTLLRATALARAVRPAIRLRMIGKAPNVDLDERWRGLAAELGIADAVAFEPSALRPGVAAAMQTASVLVHASRRETFGVVPVEALAAGLPVIATATDGVSETLRLVGGSDGRAVGRLVPVEDPEALAAAILDVLEHRAAFDPAALRATVEPHFGFDSVGRRLLDLYAEVLAAATPDGDGSSVGAGGPLVVGDGPRAALLVGLDRPRVARALRGLPEDALRALSIVTTAVDQGADLPTALGVRTLVDSDAAFRAALAATGGVATSRGLTRRVARLVRHPLGPLRRRGLRARRPAMREAAIADALRAAVAAAGEADLVACDGADLRALARAGVTPTRVLPGSMRWLADRAAPRRSAPPLVGRPGVAPPVAPIDPVDRAPFGEGPMLTSAGDPVLRIGLYAPADLNVIDGSSIWLESATATLAAIEGTAVRVLLRAPETRDIVTRRLRLPNVRLARPGVPLADPSGRAQPVEAVEALEIEDEREPFDLLVLRGYDVCRHAVRRGRFAGRLVATYVLEPERDLADPAYRRGLEEIAASSGAIAVQTSEMGALLADAVPTTRDRLVLLPPAVPPTQLAEPSWRRDDRCYYVGKFHPFYAVDRIVEAVVRLRAGRPGLTLEVAGDKVLVAGAATGERARLEALLRDTPGVTWLGGLDRDTVLQVLKAGGLAISVWDYSHGSHVNDLVVSTKLLDYCAAGLPTVATPTTVLRRLLGVDYPGFNPSVDQLQATMARLLDDPDDRQEAARRTSRVARAFTYDAVAAELAAALRRLGLVAARGSSR